MKGSEGVMRGDNWEEFEEERKMKWDRAKEGGVWCHDCRWKAGVENGRRWKRTLRRMKGIREYMKGKK